MEIIVISFRLISVDSATLYVDWWFLNSRRVTLSMMMMLFFSCHPSTLAWSAIAFCLLWMVAHFQLLIATQMKFRLKAALRWLNIAKSARIVSGETERRYKKNWKTSSRLTVTVCSFLPGQQNSYLLNKVLKPSSSTHHLFRPFLDRKLC